MSIKFSTLFSFYTAAITALIVALAWVTLYSVEKARWWDQRMQLSQESHSLHLRLEANLFRLFKQHSDALLLGTRDQNVDGRELQARIKQNLAGIRDVIAREIELVGEEEIEELALLDAMEDDIRQVDSALSRLSASGEPLETRVQLQRLADVLDRKIDIHLTELIEASLAEEVEELEEVKAAAAAFRTRNERLVYALLVIAFGLLVTGLIAFHAQIRLPLLRLQGSMARLRRADFSTPHELGGSREFRDLSIVLGEMAEGLCKREASREEQRRQLEAAVQSRTVELQGLITRLEAGEDNRKRLMADISHELRTPLTIILGEANVALRTSGRVDDDVSDALTRIRDAARHTSQIVDDMLTVARQEAGHLRLNRKTTDLRTILKDAVQMFPHDVELRLTENEAVLAVDDVRLRQSVLALFHNAWRYGGATIVATLSMTSATLSIVVEDDGVGLSDDEKQRAFERFYRGSNASGSGVGGTGLGLPVVKSIVEAHEGQVVLEDSDLGGLAVRIELPRQPPVRVINAERPRKRA